MLLTGFLLVLTGLKLFLGVDCYSKENNKGFTGLFSLFFAKFASS